jgi:DNA-directed RNA polymerase II subunit RPB9
MDVDNDWNQEELNDELAIDNDWNQEMTHEMQQTLQDQPLLMRFCPRDSSMLYPKENKSSRTLEYACRLCQYAEQSANPLIFRNVIKKEVKNVLHTVPSAVSDDPTLARSANAACDNCGHHEAVFFQSDTGQSDSLALIFVCCNCDHKWVQ